MEAKGEISIEREKAEILLRPMDAKEDEILSYLFLSGALVLKKVGESYVLTTT